MGNFDRKGGKKLDSREGKFQLAKKNDSAEVTVNFSQRHKMTIMNTSFES